MPYFYGVYLRDTNLSAGLEAIRFLGEPDSIRASHITLRGPRRTKFTDAGLWAINQSDRYHWKIKLLEPGHFFSNSQRTVILKVDLCSLRNLLHKPDFPNATPHLTLYDGKDLPFAKKLYSLLLQYDFYQELAVGKMREIQKKQKVDEIFISFFMSFWEIFTKVGSDRREILNMREVPNERRLILISRVLEELRELGYLKSRSFDHQALQMIAQ